MFIQQKDVHPCDLLKQIVCGENEQIADLFEQPLNAAGFASS